jgi:hypothetical protein
MLIGGGNDFDARLIEPALYPFGRFVERQWSLVQAGVGPNSHKRGKNLPAKADWICAAQLRVPPLSRRFVMGRKAVLRVEQQIDVDEDHEWSSPSARVRRSPMLS